MIRYAEGRLLKVTVDNLAVSLAKSLRVLSVSDHRTFHPNPFPIVDEMNDKTPFPFSDCGRTPPSSTQERFLPK